MERVQTIFLDKLCLEYEKLLAIVDSETALLMIDKKWFDYLELYNVNKVDILQRIKETENG